MRPGLNLIVDHDPRDMDFFYGEMPESLKSNENQKYFLDMAEGFDKIAMKNYQKRIENIAQTRKEIEEFEDYNFYGRGC